MPEVWKIVGRANPFTPWIELERGNFSLEQACVKADAWKRKGRFYAVHVRAI